MAVQYQRIRLGAPDSMILDALLASPLDMGASIGGASFLYNPKYLPIEIDQTILPASAFKTNEDVGFGVAMAQQSVSALRIAMSLVSSAQSTVAAGNTATPTGVTIQNIGAAGGATVSYKIVPVGTSGDGIPSSTATSATSNATLSTTNFNFIQWTNTATATGGYKIERTAGGPGTGIIGFVGPGITSFSDTGQAGVTYTDSVAQATNANVDTLWFGGDGSVPTHTFDWTTPKNDGTGNHWVGHLNRVFTSKQITVNWARDKVTELNKVELMALADTTQAIGKQAGWLAEQY